MHQNVPTNNGSQSPIIQNTIPADKASGDELRNFHACLDVEDRRRGIVGDLAVQVQDGLKLFGNIDNQRFDGWCILYPGWLAGGRGSGRGHDLLNLLLVELLWNTKGSRRLIKQ